MNKALEALRATCRECEKELARYRKRCPWRSISGDYCGEYENMREKLKEMTERLDNEKRRN